jgi:Fur family ferric uptake transcriptional regulator
VPSSTPASPATELGARLRRADIRLTEPRGTVIDLVTARGSGHFTALDLLADARTRHVRIGRATVFRTLDLLLAAGAIERLDLPDGEHAYVACRPSHHHHVICTRCGRAVDVSDGDLRGVVGAVERVTGFAIADHRLELYGHCPDCQRAVAAP